jgi:hypothetical protein
MSWPCRPLLCSPTGLQVFDDRGTLGCVLDLETAKNEHIDADGMARPARV